MIASIYLSVHPFLSVILFPPKPLQYFPLSMGQTTGVAMVICTGGLVPTILCCLKESPPQFLSDLHYRLMQVRSIFE